MNRLTKAKKHNKKISFVDIGLIENVCFTKYYPLIKGLDWNIEKRFVQEIKDINLGQAIADIIIYLDATEETLIHRKELDTTRERKHHRDNVKLAKYQKRHLENLKKEFKDRIYIIDANRDVSKFVKDIEDIIDNIQINSAQITTSCLLNEVFNE